MRIAIDCRMISSSGIGTFLKNFLEHLPGEHYYLLIGQGSLISKYIHVQNYSIIECSILPFSLHEFFRMNKQVINQNDAYFTPNYNIPLGIKIPIVCMVHDVVFLDCKNIISFVGFMIRYIYLKRSISISKHIITVSFFSKERIQYHFGNKIPITVVYNDISPNLRKYLKENNKKKKEKNNYYIFVGNIKKHKGLQVLLNAFNQLNDGTELLIVGKYENFKTSFEIDKSINNVHFTGYIEDEELYNSIKEAKALIQPSYYEGFGIPPLESLWLKTPVILSDISVFKELYYDCPVSFFRVGDDKDLLLKMKNITNIDYDPFFLNSKFNSTNSCKKIIEILQGIK